ncbi:hypothetical protein Ddye_029252 [Dipteronia dyeriana]|uniref:Uncharacterized protein n=1 Tax=Dipteronia dyeriana TaxID=168575 RepID=A0AAD9TE14_9ROSI|nr:hypothetical protein Ddye_029252 [Dipteronia dyeriana]
MMMIDDNSFQENVIFFVSFNAVVNSEHERRLPSRRLVIAIKDIIRSPMKDNFNDLYIVYELMDTDLHQIIRSHQDLMDDHCRLIRLYATHILPLHDINEEPVCLRPFSFDFEHPSFIEENIKELIYRETVNFNPDPTH